MEKLNLTFLRVVRQWPIRLAILIIVIAGAVKWQSVLQPGPVRFPALAYPSPNAKSYIDDAALSLQGPIDDVAPYGELKPDGFVTLNMVQRDTLVGQNRRAFDKLQAGLKYTYMANPDDEQAAFKMYGKQRSLVRALRTAGDSRAARGDWGDAAKYYLDGINIGVDLPHGSNLIGMLVGDACEGIGRKSMSAAVDHLSADQAMSAAQRLAKMDSIRTPFYETLQFEERSCLPQILQIFKSNNWRRQDFGDTGQKFDMVDMARYYAESPKSIVSNYLQFMDQSINLARQPWPVQLKTKPPALPNTPIYQTIGAEFLQARFRAETTSALDRLLEVQLALRSYKLTNGKYPESLQQLTPACIPSVPIDPFGANSELKYRLNGTGYVLYSVGPDTVDNGGAPTQDSQDKADPHSLWNMNDEGDIVAGVND